MAQAPAAAPQPNNSSSGAGGGGRARAAAHGGFWALLIGSIGVVYGDIGTSPLYAFKESFAHVAAGRNARQRRRSSRHRLARFLGADDCRVLEIRRHRHADGQQGRGRHAFAYGARAARARQTARRCCSCFGVAGASMFYGDALITPAISVLSAVEGLKASKV
jgi:KUP system potassium uptake protein